GAMYGVNRATAARWLVTARKTVRARTIESLRARLELNPKECESLLGLVNSQLEVSMLNHLEPGPGEAPGSPGGAGKRRGAVDDGGRADPLSAEAPPRRTPAGAGAARRGAGPPRQRGRPGLPRRAAVRRRRRRPEARAV